VSSIRVLRVYHSAVVGAWRARDRALEQSGASVTLVTARRWNEGGSVVALDRAAHDQQVIGLRTLGRHPYRFVYEPVGLARVMRSRAFDVIDIHEEPASLAAAEVQLTAWLLRVRAPFCLYSAQNIPKRYPAPFRWFEQIALRRATAVHTCNDAAEEILRWKGFRGIVRNLGLGVDIERFAAAARHRPRSPLLVGYVGRLEPHKGVAVLVDAIRDAPSCRLEIVGDGPERFALEQQVQALELSDRVCLRGYVQHDELVNVYASFDVVAVPSLETPTWTEQFGRVAVEAMASGAPVVASDSGSLRELLAGRGLLVPPGDARALAAALEALARNPAEQQRLGQLGQEFARRYSWTAVAAAQRDLYEEMIASAR
jgi:glycosyltransferase involved in cell wall biosynthesis